VHAINLNIVSLFTDLPFTFLAISMIKMKRKLVKKINLHHQVIVLNKN